MKTTPKNFVQCAIALAALALGISVIQTAYAASWVTNSPVTSARYSHTATLLPNGKVLVAGGWNGSYLSSAELFDPTTGKCTPTGSMTTNRCYHTATLLPNGKVLVVGGYRNESPDYLFSAELYDPASGTGASTGSTIYSRVSHTATLLANGKVLVVGGTGYTAELYDPTSGTWTNTGEMSRARWNHTATLLTNGNVLVAGGDYNYLPPGFFPTAEVYNPLTGTWTSTSAMTTNRTSPTATLLPNGQVLVAGGWLMAQVQTNPPAYSSFSLTSGELYDPVTGNWTATTNTMTVGRNDHTASLLPNGQVLVAAGFQNGPGDRDSMELFDPVTSAWIMVTNKLNNARSHHTATLLPSGRILVVGGIGPNGVTDSTELFDYATGTWTSNAMVTAHFYHTATLLPNGNVLVTGGNTSNCELYNPTPGTWTNTGAPNIAHYQFTTTLLPSGKVLIAGGLGDNGATNSAEIYDPSSELWTVTGSLNTPRRFATAALLRNGKVLTSGGHNDNIHTSVASTEWYDIASGKWTTTGSMNVARNQHIATSLTNGKILVAGGFGTNSLLSSAELFDPATGTWTTTGSLNVARYHFAAVLLPNGKVLVAAGIGNISTYLSSAELYDPATGSWTLTGSLSTPREWPTMTLLSDGRVLLAGGDQGVGSYISTVEIYDPATGKWKTTGALNAARSEHTSTLLANGKVLVTGGDGFAAGNSAELFDPGFAINPGWRPQITSINSPLNLGSSLVITGSQFRGIAEGSGGNGQDSPTDYPVVQLRSIESGQTTFLLTTNWSTNSFTSLPVWNFPPGYALATVFVNGIPSTSSIVNISVPIPTTTVLTDAKKTTNGFQFAFTNSPGAIYGVLASINLVLPLTNWTALSGVVEISPGQFQFIDPQATNNPKRFYLIRSP